MRPFQLQRAPASLREKRVDANASDSKYYGRSTVINI